MPRLLYMFAVFAIVLGCSSPEATYKRSGTPAVTVEFRRASAEPVDGWVAMDADDEMQLPTLYVCPNVEIDNDDLVSTGVRQNDTRILLKLNAAAAKRFGELSEAMLGSDGVFRERLAMLVDGKLVVAPIITAPMHDGVIPVSGPWTRTKAEQLAEGFVSDRSSNAPQQ